MKVRDDESISREDKRALQEAVQASPARLAYWAADRWARGLPPTKGQADMVIDQSAEYNRRKAMEPQKITAEEITQFREHYKLSKAGMARICGITRMTIHNWEKGVHKPPKATWANHKDTVKRHVYGEREKLLGGYALFNSRGVLIPDDAGGVMFKTEDEANQAAQDVASDVTVKWVEIKPG